MRPCLAGGRAKHVAFEGLVSNSGGCGDYGLFRVVRGSAPASALKGSRAPPQPPETAEGAAPRVPAIYGLLEFFVETAPQFPVSTGKSHDSPGKSGASTPNVESDASPNAADRAGRPEDEAIAAHRLNAKKTAMFKFLGRVRMIVCN
jgi:hypothetical protein